MNLPAVVVLQPGMEKRCMYPGSQNVCACAVCSCSFWPALCLDSCPSVNRELMTSHAICILSISVNDSKTIFLLSVSAEVKVCENTWDLLLQTWIVLPNIARHKVNDRLGFQSHPKWILATLLGLQKQLGTHQAEITGMQEGAGPNAANVFILEPKINKE